MTPLALARPGPLTRAKAMEVDHGRPRPGEDALATEEPLEIRVSWAGLSRPVAVTMRTPGADFELAVGFLFSEGVIHRREQVRRVSYCVGPALGDAQHYDAQQYNVVNVELAAGHPSDGRGPAGPDLSRLERHFSMTSACGVCGKASLEGLRLRGYQKLCPEDGPFLRPEVLVSLPTKLRAAQRLFDATGGLHACGLFSAEGDLLAVREDVGRHNAMDKLTGWALLAGRTPLDGHVVVASGRSSFELVQKALACGACALCSVSAPSSLAVDLARELGLTLVGFLRGDRFKVYAGAERLALG